VIKDIENHQSNVSVLGFCVEFVDNAPDDVALVVYVLADICDGLAVECLTLT
jgi:hypothetical protein